MKLSHTLVYSILSFFIATVVFSQDQSNTKKGTGTVSTNGAGGGGCTGTAPTLSAIGGGSASVCVGGITPNFTNSYAGGTWSIVNGTGTATIYNYRTGIWSRSAGPVGPIGNIADDGKVKGVTSGTVQVKYTAQAPGGTCTSSVTQSLMVSDIPVVSITGSNAICVNETTQLSPTTGGIWSSNNPAVATVSYAGVVTGVSAGTATFTFAVLGGVCRSLASPAVTVNTRPVVSITGSNAICVNETTQLSPTTGGIWSSNNPAVATVSYAGVVTGVTAGTATFTFTGTGGCTSLATPAVTVNAKPTVGSINGNSGSVCVGSTMNFSNSTPGGQWSVDNTSLADIDFNGGTLLGKLPGTVVVSYSVVSNGCSTRVSTTPISINARPTVSITGSNSICTGATTQLSPSTGGTWTSSNSAVATVSNAGVVTGVSAGTATFTFTGTTGCVSLSTASVTVNATPTVSITGSNAICEGATTQLSPSTGGTWTSSNIAATVNNTGLVTGFVTGTATFTFTGTNGCVSLTTPSVTVNRRPIGIIAGPNWICIGTTTQLSSNMEGTWTSSNSAVATASNAAVVTGVSAGTATLTFTAINGCVSLATVPITVNATPVVSITESNAICINATTQLSPSTGGTWVSSNPAVATVSNGGLVTGVSAGTATFIFTETGGCASLPSAAVTVNATPTVSPITGGASTVCMGSKTQFSNATSGGVWTITNGTGSATINDVGEITTIAAGTVSVVYSTTGNCATSVVAPLLILALPEAGTIIGSSTTIRLLETQTFTNSTPSGVWEIINETGEASIDGFGVVKGLKIGTVKVAYAVSANGCENKTTLNVQIDCPQRPNRYQTQTVCEGKTITYTPNTQVEGVWSITNGTGRATISSEGVVTAITAGNVSVHYNLVNGCDSGGGGILEIVAAPTISPITGGATKVCIGTNTRFANNTEGGVWSITNGTGSASIDDTGLVTGVAAGTVQVNYTVDNGTCKSYATPQEITINATVGANINGPDTAFIGYTNIRYSTGPAGGTWSVRDGTGTARIAIMMGGFHNQEFITILNPITAGTVKVIYTYNDPCGSSVSIEKEVTILASCTLNNPNSLIVQGLYEKLLAHLYDRARKGDTNAQINGSTPAELIALRPYIKNSLADKIYNFSYSKNLMKPYTESLSFSFSPEGDNDVLIINEGISDYMTGYVSYNTVSKNSVSYYIPQAMHDEGDYDRIQSYEIKNIDFCPSVICTPMSGDIKKSIASPTTVDSINFSLETTATNVTYNWTFKELDNLTPKGTATTPVASQTFSIPGNYRVLLFAKDGNGCEGNFYTDVIVKQTCVPIVGHIKVVCKANVTATPALQTILSGQATVITLTSTDEGTSYSWIVSQTGSIGATAGSGNSIMQTLTNTGSTTGTVMYTITPRLGSCYGTPINVSINIETQSYNSIARSGSFTRNNCGSGVGSSVNFTLPAGAVTSTISQEDADTNGLIKFNADGLAYANANGTCTFTFSSIARSGSFTRNNCGSGVGSSVSFTLPAGAVTSTISQEDADTRALTRFNTDGQNNANVNGTCTFSFSSIARNGLFTKNNCESGNGSSVSFTLPAGAIISTTSQEDADARGLTKFNTDGLAYANANGTCSSYHFLFSSPGRTASSLACGQTNFSFNVYASDRFLMIGTQLYTSPTLGNSRVGSGNFWYLEGIDGITYRIDNNGQIAEIIPCP